MGMPSKDEMLATAVRRVAKMRFPWTYQEEGEKSAVSALGYGIRSWGDDLGSLTMVRQEYFKEVGRYV